MASRESGRKEFRVGIDLDLDERAVARIEKAIQKAVLIELASTDVADGYSVALRAPQLAEDDPGFIPDLQTDGIWIRDEKFVL